MSASDSGSRLLGESEMLPFAHGVRSKVCMSLCVCDFVLVSSMFSSVDSHVSTCFGHCHASTLESAPLKLTSTCFPKLQALAQLWHLFLRLLVVCQ